MKRTLTRAARQLSIAVALLLLLGCNNENSDRYADEWVPIVPVIAGIDSQASTRDAGTPGKYEITIDGGQPRTYALASGGSTLTLDSGQEPVMILRTAITARVLMYGTESIKSGIDGQGVTTFPYIIQDPAYTVTGADRGAATLTLAITPASARVSIKAITDKALGGLSLTDFSVVAPSLNSPGIDAAGYLFDVTDPAAIALQAGAALTSLPAQCLPTTLGAGATLFVLTGETNTAYHGRTYTVAVPTEGITLAPGRSYHFAVELDNSAASIISTDITPFGQGDDITGAAIPDGYDVVIANAKQLAAFRDRVNNGETGLRAIQVADIVLPGDDWIPIGNDNRFQGTYNGGGCLITGLQKITVSWAAGLFGYVGAEAILTGIHLRGVAINNDAFYLGALAGFVDAPEEAPAVISHCTAEGKVEGKEYTGGLVGFMNYTHLTHCHAACTVTGGGWYAGGLAGVTDYSIIAACSATGGVGGSEIVGGLVGYADRNSKIYACRATGKVTAGGNYSGGFVGSNDSGSTITGCYATGGVSGGNGGTFAGMNYGTITDCHAVPGADGGVTETVGVNNGNATIATEDNLRYTTVAATDIADLDGVRTILRKSGTGEAILPPEEKTFKASEIWTKGNMPETIDN